MPRFKCYSRILLSFITAVSLFTLSLNGVEVGIIGGGDAASFYGALVSEKGVATKITGHVPQGNTAVISSVGISKAGTVLLGGENSNNNIGFTYYAGTVNLSTGVATRLSGAAPIGNGQIYSVAINDTGMGLIGGDSGYAATVSPGGFAALLTGDVPGAGVSIISVAINDTGMGLIGGDNSGYAARVSPGGVATLLTGATPGGGAVRSVAINDTGMGLIGGDSGYAARVSPGGVATLLTGATPGGGEFVESVAINDTGMGLIGGSGGYAARASPGGVATLLTGDVPPTGTFVESVAINNAGMGLVGGTSRYVVRVSPEGVATQVNGGGFDSVFEIQAVTINNAGIGLIAGAKGDAGDTGYAAFVSPSGNVIELTGELPLSGGNSFMQSVALLDVVVPKSWGPGNSYPNALFALSTQVLSNHMEGAHDTPSRRSDDVGLLVEATESVRGNFPCQDNTKYAVWFAPFGAYAHNKEEQNFPSMTNWIGGGMLGFDYRGIENTIVGVGTAYAFNRVNYSDDDGHARVHQEFLSVYGSWGKGNILIDMTLWGGFYQMHNKRNTLKYIHSKAHVNGWLLSPHLGISTPFYAVDDWFTIAPFVMFDWANNWQGKVRETGSSGLNIRVGRHYTSMLRSEAGLRFYEMLRYQWGNLTFEEKVGYINKKPFNTSSESAYFAGSPSTFGIEVFPGKTQNLGVVALSAKFNPCKSRYPFGSISYQGEFGFIFQSHVLIFEIGKRF